METKNAYIIAGSIIIASCIIALSLPKSAPPHASSPEARGTAPVAPEPAPVHALAETPEEKLIGRWHETATWGSLEISPDGTAVFASPPNSIRCRWSIPEEGKIKTVTDTPKEGAPGIFGDLTKVRTWTYSFTPNGNLILTFKGSGENGGGDERLAYMRVSENRESAK